MSTHKPVDKDSNCTELCCDLRLLLLKPYPPKSTYHLLAGFLHYACSQAVRLDPKDERFKAARHHRHTFSKTAAGRCRGRGNHADIIKADEEDLLWGSFEFFIHKFSRNTRCFL